jgi:gluconate 2-dehydrogenase gamma chain
MGTAAIAQTQSSTTATPAVSSPTSHYTPRYFTAPEWEFLQAAVDRLIPANEDGPGALEAGVPEFLDRQMEAAYGHGGLWYMQGPFTPDAVPTLGYQLRYTPREFYRKGIATIDEWCQKQHNNKFAALPADQRDAILHQLEKGEIKFDDVPAATFFAQLLTNTKEGYFADPIYGGNKNMGAWKMIGFPGARADYADWIEQPGKVYPFGPVSIDEAKS